MDDAEVIGAFLDGAAGPAFGPSLHVEQGTLKLGGWWAVAYRISDVSYIVRDEAAPDDSTARADLEAGLTERGLTAVGADLPAITLLTYTTLDLGYAPWMLWSTDLATGEAHVNARATQDTFLQGDSFAAAPIAAADPALLRAARRVAGTASRIVLAVGLTEDRTAGLAEALVDTRFEHRALGQIAAADGVALFPTLVLVDATSPAGREFVAELQAEAGAGAPIVAVTEAGAMLSGADATVDADAPPEAWLGLIRDLLT